MSVVDTNTTKYTVQILYVGSCNTIYVHSASNTGWLPYLINAPKTKYHPAAIIYIVPNTYYIAPCHSHGKVSSAAVVRGKNLINIHLLDHCLKRGLFSDRGRQQLLF